MEILARNLDLFRIKEACDTLGVSRSAWYRHRRPKPPDRRRPPRKLQQGERAEVLATLNSQTYQDESVPSAHTQLLDHGTYLCSQRTMYRILQAEKQVRQRRNRREHPVYQKPELLATAPNQVWSWDITKVKGPQGWISYQLYVVLDVFSRYVVSWCLSEYESGEQAKALIASACARESIQEDQLTVHADRGGAMRSKCLTELFGQLGVRPSFNRPHVSNDNPYSESHFKTLKYHPDYPERFGSIEDARNHMRIFFPWYNTEHRHSGIAMMTPEWVHTGRANQVREKRQLVLAAAYREHPERFVRGRPEAKGVPEEVWINKPNIE